jgi:hypothetical protein
LQLNIKSRKAEFLSLLEEKMKYRKKMRAPIKLGRHTYLPQMGCVIVHAQISCLVSFGQFRFLRLKDLGLMLKKCQSIRFCGSYDVPVMRVHPSDTFKVVEGVYLGSFVARRIQRVWRRYMVRRRRMALCMASNPRLGAGASPLLGAVIRVLCVEDLVRIV